VNGLDRQLTIDFLMADYKAHSSRLSASRVVIPSECSESRDLNKISQLIPSGHSFEMTYFYLLGRPPRTFKSLKIITSHSNLTSQLTTTD